MAEKITSTKLAEGEPIYEGITENVIDVERAKYLIARRRNNNLPDPTDDDIAGLCISGGGVRSATLGLGMLRAMIAAGKLRYVDYLSTVSGGGYIGACMTSLLSNEPIYKSVQGQHENKRFSADQTGVDETNSPFRLLNYQSECKTLENTVLTSKYQLDHLRKRGEYLTPNKSLLSWDVKRVFGSLSGGIIMNVVTFILLVSLVVLIHHALLVVMSKGTFMQDFRHPELAINNDMREDMLTKSATKTLLVNVSTRKPEELVQLPFSAQLDLWWESLNSQTRDSLQQASRSDWDTLNLNNKSKLAFQFHYKGKIDTLACLDSMTHLVKIKGGAVGTQDQFTTWWNHRLGPQITLLGRSLFNNTHLAWYFVLAGFLIAWLYLWRSREYPIAIARQEAEEQQYDTSDAKAQIGSIHDRSAGQDMEATVSGRFKLRFSLVSYALGPVLAYSVVTCLHYTNHLGGYDYLVMLMLPFCFSVGLLLGTTLLTAFYYLNQAQERVSGRLYRSFLHGMQGAAFLGVIFSALIPIAIILLFGKHGLAFNLLISLVPVASAYFFTIQSLSSKTGGSGLFNNLAKKIQMPLLNLSVYLVIGLTFAWVSVSLYNFEKYMDSQWHFSYTAAVFLLLGVIGLLLLAFGFAVNSNDLSLHYFYRDRLTEAYLRTDGLVKRPKPAQDTCPPAEELIEVNLRNHENLLLSGLGEGNNTGPYHLIIGALNLQGSHDPAKKSLESDHFVFSKYYIGSRTTGYFRTDRYFNGKMKLSSAMAISAAAVSSGMGSIGFAASNFFMTLFNLRTGYWIENPSFLQRELCIEGKQKRKESVKISLIDRLSIRFKKRPFWLGYLASEFTGMLNAHGRRVYVSDGGHTGDNLGLIPLVQRQCKTIVIADFEEDGTFSFASFNQAVRLAKSIYDADVEIDLRPLLPKKNEDGTLTSRQSVVTGTIKYENGKTGDIIYMKSSLNLIETDADQNPANFEAAATQSNSPAPVYVLNYFKTNPNFPHQSTADQYFDEVQFEAYKMLGEHIGHQAAKVLRFKLEAATASPK